MFTGIIEETGAIISAQSGKLVVAAGAVLKDMEPGGSIAVNGVCLTVTGFDAKSFSVDIMSETIKRSNLGQLAAGDRVNLERPLALGGRLGGHLVQGHVDATGRVASIRRSGEENLITIEAPAEVMGYAVEKGFIAVDGISLTVVAKDANSFQVSIVGYTRRHTTLEDKRVGDTVNLEVDIIAKYVEQLSQSKRTTITMDFLQEHGFLVS
ncbi:MAG: riboflavin synthase [Chloroflexi bacterium]|nr:riboflavin synthase [Chloroflexota bacterium]